MTSPHERRVAWQANHLAPSSALVPANPQTAAHRAAERRRGAEGTTSLLDAMSLWCPLAEEKRPFNRLLNDQLLAKTTKNQAIETLTTLLQLTENELPPHKASSPRSIRFRNLKFRRVVIEVSGALEYIIECGFRKEARDFEEHLSFSGTPSQERLQKLRVGHHVLSETLARTQNAQALEEIRSTAAREEADGRVKKILLDIAEDTRVRKEGEYRRKAAQRARNGGELREVDRNPVPTPGDF